MLVRRHLLVIVVLAVAGALVVPLARADEEPAPGAQLAEACTESALATVPEAGPRACKSFDSGAVLTAQTCTQGGGPPATCAALTDGVVVDEATIAAYEQSWVAHALRLQQRLDERQPLRNTLWPHTHNSYNSTAYPPAVSSSDSNQRWTILDQLRMGIRGIELDVHWVPSPHGSAATGGRAVVLCHGQGVDARVTVVHAGCSVDRPLMAGLREIREFLDRPGNEREVVLLYLENNLDGDPTAHDLVAAALDEAFDTGSGTLVAQPPPDASCAPMPLGTSRAELLARGARVLIVGNCGPGAWGRWVHERGPQWSERSGAAGYPSFPDCQADREQRAYDDKFIRVYDDITWLSAMESGESEPFEGDDVRAMVRCGVDLIGFDRIHPFDGRLDALVWSWAPGESFVDPARRCASWGADARFHASSCAERRRFACRTPSGSWVVPPTRARWDKGSRVCARAGARFDVPATGWDNEQLRTAAAGAGELWLAYASPAGPGLWAPTS